VQLRLLRSDLETDLQDLTPGAKTQREEDRISIAINADSIATWALPALSPLVNTGMPLEIITDDQDFTHEWLREGQVLGCVTTLKQALRGCKVLALGDMRYVAVASKAFAAAQCPQGLTPHNFRQIPFVAFNRKDDLQTDFVGRALGLRRVALSQRFVPSSEGQVHAVQAGWGASVVPQLLVKDQIDSGDLVNLTSDFSLPVSLYWHCWNLDSDVIDRLTHALAQGAAQALGTTIKPTSHKITPQSAK
jgi:LysR family transcriptional regulator (chromosome initiation inhibitor)